MIVVVVIVVADSAVGACLCRLALVTVLFELLLLGAAVVADVGS